MTQVRAFGQQIEQHTGSFGAQIGQTGEHGGQTVGSFSAQIETASVAS